MKKLPGLIFFVALLLLGGTATAASTGNGSDTSLRDLPDPVSIFDYLPGLGLWLGVPGSSPVAPWYPGIGVNRAAPEGPSIGDDDPIKKKKEDKKRKTKRRKPDGDSKT